MFVRKTTVYTLVEINHLSFLISMTIIVGNNHLPMRIFFILKDSRKN